MSDPVVPDPTDAASEPDSVSAPDDRPWTLERICDERPDLAPLANLHRLLAETAERVVAGEGAASFHPRHTGAPATHWVLGNALFDGCDQRSLLVPLITLFGALARTLQNAFPEVGPAVEELRTAVSADDFPWADRIAKFRDPIPGDVMPHPALFRFLLLRALATPLAHLARATSPPHADRWIRAACPYCGFPPVAQVARPGSSRHLLCVLCGGGWTWAEPGCVGCGSALSGEWRVVANRDLGPASLESCGTCGTTLKVFPPLLVEARSSGACEPIVALEILTVGLDLLAREQEGIQREQAPLGAVFPPP